MRAYQTMTNKPCQHFNVELLLVSRMDSNIRPLMLVVNIDHAATILTSLNGSGCPWLDVSGRALKLMDDILRSYYKCTLSAITEKLNVSGHMLCGHVFLFWCVEFMRKFGLHLSVTFCM
jgi:hypothetical protein